MIDNLLAAKAGSPQNNPVVALEDGDSIDYLPRFLQEFMLYFTFSFPAHWRPAKDTNYCLRFTGKD